MTFQGPFQPKPFYDTLVYKAAKGNSNSLVMDESTVQVCEKGIQRNLEGTFLFFCKKIHHKGKTPLL